MPSFSMTGATSIYSILFGHVVGTWEKRVWEGEPIPPNTLAALKRDLERHRIVKQQIRDIERTRLERLEKAPAEGPHAMVLLLARVIGIGVETADMLVAPVIENDGNS